MRKIEFLVAVSFIGVYTLAATIVSLNRFWQFDAFWYDFGILDETLWKLSRWQLPIIPTLNPPLGALVWSDHFNPSAALLAPIYWLTNKPEIALIAQTIAVGLSAFVLYHIARKIVSNGLVRITLVVSYLGFVGMQNALYTDIHNIVFSLLPLSLVFWAIYHKKWRVYWIFFLIFLGFQESLAGVGVGLGLLLLLRSERNLRVGIITLLISLFYGFLATKFLMPAFSGRGYSYQPTYPSVWSGWVTQLFSPDIKLRTLLLTFATFGLLPLLSFSTLPLIVEHYLERFVFNTVQTRWDLGFHYNALISLLLVIAALEVLARARLGRYQNIILSFWAITTILLVIFLHRFYLHGPLLLATNPVFYNQTKRAVFLENLVAKIPKKGLIMTQNNLAAHLTHYDVTLLSKDYQRTKPDWIVLDTRPGQNPNNFFPLSPDQFARFSAEISTSSAYTRYYQSANQLIYEKN